jgi:uncharacterized heparinase superfamily protein
METAAWLCGPQHIPTRTTEGYGAPIEIAHGSRGFPQGGFYIMRSADTSMVIDAGEVGMRGIGGHGHNDVLSFDLWAAGAGVLVDSGTYTYSADPKARQALRSVAAHNGLRVDGEETSRLATGRTLWLIENDAHPFDIGWQSDSTRDVFHGRHDGYRRLIEAVDHTRSIVFDKQRLTWRIEDRVDGRGTHVVELFFHPGVPIEIEGNAVRLCAPRGDLWLFPPVQANFRQEQGWISKGYGLREPAPVLVYAVRGAVPIHVRTDLVLVGRGTPVDVARSKLELD